MRALWFVIATTLLATTDSVLAESKWLESGRLETSEVKVLCERVSDVRLLARMQMFSAGNERWRRLSRQALVIEAVVMGAPPLDPGRCYVIARGGPTDEGERSVFEVRDFTVSPESTSVLTIGRAYDEPSGWAHPEN
jgi:hypothetical protein